MTEKPRRPKRQSDVIANAIKVARIATGEDEDVYVEKDETAAAAGMIRAARLRWPRSPHA